MRSAECKEGAPEAGGPLFWIDLSGPNDPKGDGWLTLHNPGTEPVTVRVEVLRRPREG